MLSTTSAPAPPLAGSSQTSESPEPTRTTPRQKRIQVARACEWCRIHRVKCDNAQPCTNCLKRGGSCSNHGPKRTTTLPQAFREIEALRLKVAQLEHDLQAERDKGNLCTPGGLSHRTIGCTCDDGNGEELPRGIHIDTPASADKLWYGPSSMIYFISRMKILPGLILQQYVHQVQCIVHRSSSTLFGGGGQDELGPLVQDPTVDEGGDLSPTQEEYFLNLYWQSYHTSYPILDEAEFRGHYRTLWAASSGQQRAPSALVDIVVALCMQHGSANQGQETNSNSNVYSPRMWGRWHYDRCQTLLAPNLEVPTIARLQCHILSCIYLSCGSLHNTADLACSAAARTAYMLGLHLEPPETMPRRERELRKRLWWTIYVLDSHIGMTLGRPFVLPEARCTLPADDEETADLSGSGYARPGGNATWLTYNLFHIRLVLAVRAAHADLHMYHQQVKVDAAASSESRLAAVLEPHTEALGAWAQSVPEALQLKRQTSVRDHQPFAIPSFPGPPVTEPPLPSSSGLGSFFPTALLLQNEPFTPAWLHRQRLLLELAYHHYAAILHRPLVAASADPSTTVNTTTTTTTTTTPAAAADRCTRHAAALTLIAHQADVTVLLEAFQWQLDAAVMLAALVSRPSGTETAREAIGIALGVLGRFESILARAAGAVGLVRWILASASSATASVSATSISAGESSALMVESIGHSSMRIDFEAVSSGVVSEKVAMLPVGYQDVADSEVFPVKGALAMQTLFDEQYASVESVFALGTGDASVADGALDSLFSTTAGVDAPQSNWDYPH